jgi:FixJ family two-component response regulator
MNPQHSKAHDVPRPEHTGTDSVLLLHIEDNPADAALIRANVVHVLPRAKFDLATRLADLTPERAAAADCALLDLSLPDASGLEALVVLRGMCPDLPIIVLTGFDDLPLALNALRCGAEDYLVKNSVDGYTMERAIRYAIERRKLTLALVRLARQGRVA